MFKKKKKKKDQGLRETSSGQYHSGSKRYGPRRFDRGLWRGCLTPKGLVILMLLKTSSYCTAILFLISHRFYTHQCTRHLMKCALKALYCDYLFACFISLWMKVVLLIFVFAKVVSAKWKNKYEMLVQIGVLAALLTINNKRNRTDSEKEVIISKWKLGRISER